MPGLADFLGQGGVEEWHNLDVAGFGYVHFEMQREQITHNAVSLIQALRLRVGRVLQAISGDLKGSSRAHQP